VMRRASLSPLYVGVSPVTINTHAVKTILLALTAAASFGAAVVVGMGLGGKKVESRHGVNCDPAAVAAVTTRRPNASC
jgi:imidazole glycerol phosphate synthase subunit HisF